ncbi:MAG: Ni/Fe-hydrogenase, b-type cytochrome subunit [Sulfurospirillaceae bacterium]|nr:Ni/Fe-hydrogenase, b-type cytochrome subunit [Sulfurospirillaceae bacterium]
MLNNRKKKFEFSSGLRWTHWIRVVTIIALTVTGFYIAFVFISPEPSSSPTVFLNAKFRMWHEVAGFVLIAVTLYKAYLFIFTRLSRNERVSMYDILSPKIWIQQIKYYLFIGKHPKLKGVYNPLQFAAYVFLYALIFLISITGLVLYVRGYHQGLGGFLLPYMEPVEAFMGGLASVREIHHIAMWGILIFIPIHIYMAVFNSIMSTEGSIDAIVSGYKFTKHQD